MAFGLCFLQLFYQYVCFDVLSWIRLVSWGDAGKVCQTKQPISHRRGDHSVLYSVRYHQGNTGYQNSCMARYGPYLHAIGASDRNLPKPKGAFQEADHPCLMTLKSGKGLCRMMLKQKIRGKCECYLSSNSSCSSWSQSVMLDKLNASNGQLLMSKHFKINRTRAYYKSEEYDITEAQVESLTSIEGSNEAILAEGNVQEVASWWVQFPKRWVIVFLCFAAFLLCNMDRVSISF